MKIKFFLKGPVILILTVPFLFSSHLFSQDYSIISLKKGIQKINLKFKIEIPAYRGMTFKARNILYDSLNTDSSLTIIKPKKEIDKKFRMKKSPTKAVLFSMVLPGAGQFYNESYWKIPIIGGLVGYFGYEYFRQNNLYKDFRDQYIATQTPQNPSGDLSLKTLREFYRSERDNFVWYFMIVYVVNLVDAYVDAHLFDFDVKDEKLIHYGKTDRTYRLKFNYKF